MRVALLDPRWREQRDRALEERKRHEDPYAPGLFLCWFGCFLFIRLSQNVWPEFLNFMHNAHDA